MGKQRRQYTADFKFQVALEAARGTKAVSQIASEYGVHLFGANYTYTPCTCHTFRCTFALSCLRNGMNIDVLARLMGHADITILRQYLPLLEGDLQEAHARFGAMDNLFG